jgi:DNA-directed RNA polymerase specialized sigma24 family protein
MILHLSDSTDQNAFPHSLSLCQYHHQLELMVWGIKKFFEVYHLLNVDDSEESPKNRWQEALEPLPDDSRLYFSLPEDLEFWLNRLAGDAADDKSHPRSEFEYLKDASIDLGESRLTDKQLMAVCMVFYGGVKKKRAAQAMNITSQALSDHVKAALKKIGDNLARI